MTEQTTQIAHSEPLQRDSLEHFDNGNVPDVQLAGDVYQPEAFEVTPCFKASSGNFVLLAFFISAMVLGKQILLELYVLSGADAIPPNLFVVITNGVVYLFAFMAIVKIVKIFQTSYSHRIVVTPHHVELIQGIADKKSTKINIAHIRAVDIEKSAADRIIDVGTIRIAASSTEGYEIEAPGINHPERLRDFLKHRIGVLQYNEIPDPSIRY